MDQDREIVSLNIKNLDIQELERRLELAAGLIATPDGWVCGADGCGVDCGTNCVGNCPSNCVGNCTSLCGVDGCGTDCGVLCDTNYCDYNYCNTGETVNRPVCDIP
jgi:hypothetical protein